LGIGFSEDLTQRRIKRMLTDLLIDCRDKRGTGALFVSLLFVVASWGQGVREIEPNYERYEATDLFEVSHGSVKTLPVGDKGWRLLLEAPPSEEGTKVTLSRSDGEIMSLMSIRPYVRGSAKTKSFSLTLPPDGVGLLFLFVPVPDVSVFDYEPEIIFTHKDSTPERARFPVVDVHLHVSRLGVTAESRLQVMDATGVAVAVDSPMAIHGQKTEDSYRQFEKPHPDRFLTFATVDFTNRYEQGFVADAVSKLESDIRTMNVPGVGETHDKGSGLFGNWLLPEPRGRMYLDDERLMPLWREMARLGLPILFHVSEPIPFYYPFDAKNPFLKMQASANHYNLSQTDVLSRDAMMERRNDVLREIPDLIMIGAHMGTLEDDLERLGETLDRYPHFYVEIGVRDLYLAIQPNAARKFFIKYPDRILFGQDGVQSIARYRQHFRVLESDDDRFYQGGHALYGLDLPDLVLRKVYYANAAKLMPQVKNALLRQYPGLSFPN
jgi:predicted TIM-barrel fold metal-dependent hydrolase